MIDGTIDMRQFSRAIAPALSSAVLTLLATAALAGPESGAEWLPGASKFLPEGYVLGQIIAASPDGAEATVAPPDSARNVIDRGASTSGTSK